MKRNILYLLCCGAALLASCQKDQPNTPTFDVTVPKTTYKVGEAVNFTLNGNPDYITFFSGEQGLNYANIQRTSVKGTSKLQFTSARANGTQANSLQLMVSADFAGLGSDSAGTVKNIAAASWTDVTSRATLSTGASTASGVVDLTDIATAGKPVFLAFKYSGTAGSIQNKWTISGLTLTNTLPDNTVYTIANLSTSAITNYGTTTTISPGFAGYRVTGGPNWIVTAGSSLVITGAASVASSTANAEAWVLSGKVDLFHVAPDTGVPIKETSTRLATNLYSYTFKAPGTYTATFVGADTNISGNNQVVKQITLTITP